MEQVAIFLVLALVLIVLFKKGGIYYCLAFIIPLIPNFRVRIISDIPLYFIDLILIAGLIKYFLVTYRDTVENEVSIEGCVEENTYTPWLLLILLSGTVSFLVGLTVIGNPPLYAGYSMVRTFLPITGFLWGFRLFTKDRVYIGRTSSIFVFSTTAMSLMGMGVLFDVKPVLRLTQALTPLSDSLVQILTVTKPDGRLVFDMEPATSTGGFLLCAFFIIGYLFIVETSKNKRNAAFLMVALVINGVALILTLTRSAIIGLFLGFFIFALIMLKKQYKRAAELSRALAIIVVLLIALSVGIFVVMDTIEKNNPTSNYYKAQFGLEGADVGYAKESRVDRVVSSLKYMLGDPLPAVLGSGTGSLMIGDRTGAESTEPEYINFYAHNFFFVYLMYWGLLALVIYFFIYLTIWLKMWRFSVDGRIDNIVDGALANMLTCLLPALFISFFVEHAFASRPVLSTLLWFLLGTGAYIAVHYSEEKDELGNWFKERSYS